MTQPLQRVALIVEEFAPGSAAQHLLDRFLAGYPHQGEIRPRLAPEIIVHSTRPDAGAEELRRRQKELQLQLSPDIHNAVKGADAAAVVWQGPGHAARPDVLKSVLGQLADGTACFVHGLIANSVAEAADVARLAGQHAIRLASGTATATTFRLPNVTVPPGTHLTEALVIVQGDDPLAALDGLHALLPDLVRAGRGLPSVLSTRFLSGEAVWHAGARGEWSWPLLAAAVSRSNNVQGDPVKDGRTQDIVGLGLVPKLAQNPRCWITRHEGGLRSCVLALDGVVTDLNLAMQDRRGNVLSTQLYRPPAPNQHQFSNLTRRIETHFRGPPARNEAPPADPVAVVGWWEMLVTAAARPGEEVMAPSSSSAPRRQERRP